MKSVGDLFWNAVVSTFGRLLSQVAEPPKDDGFVRMMNFSDSLSVSVAKASTWDEVPHVPNRYLGFAFDALDKEALFFEGLGVFDPAGSVGGRIPTEDYQNGKYEELLSRFDMELHDATVDLPLLRRFVPEYEDAFIAPEEIGELRRECEFVRAKTESANVHASIDKLISACDEALKDGSALVFGSD